MARQTMATALKRLRIRIRSAQKHRGQAVAKPGAFLISWCDDADGLHFKKCAVGTDFLKLTISKLLEFLEVEI